MADRLLITVEVKNPSRHDKLEFSGWSGEPGLRGATLVDDRGTSYPPKPIDPVAVLGKPVTASIGPGESARDVLAFELPGPKAQSLQLELPGVAFGKTATASFPIPVKMIADKPVVVKITPGASADGGADSKLRPKPKKHRKAQPGTPEGDFGIGEDEEPPTPPN